MTPFDTHEKIVLRRGLKVLRSKIENQIRRDKRAGWTPEPGKADTNYLTLDTIEGLLLKLKELP